MPKLEYKIDGRGIEWCMTPFFAYGINLEEETMRVRCPGAVRNKTAVLHNAQMLFVGHGLCNVTVRRAKGKVVLGKLWMLQKDHVTALDLLEGDVTHTAKKTIEVMVGKTAVQAFTFVDIKNQPLMMPYPSYFAMIVKGYEQNKFDLDHLRDTLQDNVNQIYWRE